MKKMKFIIGILMLALVILIGGCGSGGSSSEEDYGVLKNIVIENSITKKEYTEGECIALQGLKINALYEDGSIKDITNKITTNPKITDKLTVNNTKIVLSYQEGVNSFSAEIAINVYKTGDIKLNIKDINLEMAIRKELGKYEGSLTKEEVENIMYLDAQNLGIKTLSGLEPLETINTWNLDNNELTNLDGFNNIKSADTISVMNNKLTNITALSNLKTIDQLWLNKNELTNLDGLTNLEEIGLWFNASKNKLTNITALSNLKVLLNNPIGEFDLSDNQLTEVNALKNLTSTQGFIDLSNNQITNLDGLANLEYINMGLNLSNNKLTSINQLINLKQVGQEKVYLNASNKYLDLSNNQIINVDGLANLTDCYKLILDNNQITNLDGLRNYINITNSISVCDNKLYPQKKYVFISGSMPTYEYTALAKANQEKIKGYTDRTISVYDFGNEYVVETIQQ